MELTEQLKEQIRQWNEELKDKNAMGVIGYFLNYFGKRIVLSTSLGLEDDRRLARSVAVLVRGARTRGLGSPFSALLRHARPVWSRDLQRDE